MKYNRSSGILLHPTSLPGPYGIGDIGAQALQWLDFLAQTGCSLWQVLPLGPTGYGDSPYQCFSSFAGNPYLISPESLLRDGLLYPDDLSDRPSFPEDHVDYGAVITWKLSILDRSYDRFLTNGAKLFKDQYEEFKSVHASWLNDFAIFMALKDVHGGAPWPTWEADLRDRQPQALSEIRQKLDKLVERQIYRQFLFYRQWAELRDYARQKRIQIIGDIPIFVAHDSADVWAHPELFFLDQRGRPTVVAGVPPDYFSTTGQLWGNPLYRWNVHKASGYAWWLDRIRTVLNLVDFIRLDHFRGFAGYWEVPGNAKTAVNGKWKKGPGKDFFFVVKKALGDLPIIAEDLGVITPDVVAIREGFNLPGMKILQFAFDGSPENPFLPHNYVANCVAYTGTHDNDTVLGWYQRVAENEKSFCRRYMDRDGSHVSWDLIRGVWASVAMFALAPMQDFLELDNTARMNYPGNPSGNWTWRMGEGSTSEALQKRILDVNEIYGRLKS
jgi:4-alpha-glucanotransferase